jgi:hypothetical protein
LVIASDSHLTSLAPGIDVRKDRLRNVRASGQQERRHSMKRDRCIVRRYPWVLGFASIVLSTFAGCGGGPEGSATGPSALEPTSGAIGESTSSAELSTDFGDVHATAHQYANGNISSVLYDAHGLALIELHWSQAEGIAARDGQGGAIATTKGAEEVNLEAANNKVYNLWQAHPERPSPPFLNSSSGDVEPQATKTVCFPNDTCCIYTYAVCCGSGVCCDSNGNCWGY